MAWSFGSGINGVADSAGLVEKEWETTCVAIWSLHVIAVDYRMIFLHHTVMLKPLKDPTVDWAIPGQTKMNSDSDQKRNRSTP